MRTLTTSVPPYQAPAMLWNGHLQTIFPNLLRRVPGVAYQRMRIDTPDGDFLDLDWSRCGSRALVVLAHGLEGSSDREYILGMVRYLNAHGIDAVAWNCRGCSGEANRKLYYYHSGSSADLHAVVQHIQQNGSYDTIALAGFSMGGNITLKYLGEQGHAAVAQIAAAVVFSVPCDLAASCKQLSLRENFIYQKRFLRKLHRKVRIKMDLYPEQIDDRDFHKLRNLADFDERYTAPMHDFASAADYYARCSSKQFIPKIAVDTLIVNARNDPFLPELCYPVAEAAKSDSVTLEMPEHGGHVGFVVFGSDGVYWSEQRALDFLKPRLLPQTHTLRS